METPVSATESPSSASTALKRKRSPSAGAPPSSSSITTAANTAATNASTAVPAAKVAKTSNQLSINYLARLSPEDLPLISKDDNLPSLLQLLSAYSNILDRHESLASNLGARPLGPILIKRFERCFDAPPKIVASHHKGSTGGAEDVSSAHTITWLEVIEFARSHPGQFSLSTFSEGRRVCQFYYPQKQLRVQISEEDFLFINSGRCQELIPPLPIWEDEEKEVGTCDVLEVRLKELTNAADMVAARTRQLSHRLKGRRAAILERRAEGGSGTPAKAVALQTTTAPPSSSPSAGGFVAVNTGSTRTPSEGGDASAGSLTAVRNELLRHFEGLPQNQPHGRTQSRHHSTAAGSDPAQQGSRLDNANVQGDGGALSTASSLSPVPPNAFTGDNGSFSGANEPSAPSRGHSNAHTHGHRPSSSTGGGHAYHASHTPLKHNFSRPLPPAQESSQPFRPLCQAHMDSLPRGHRVKPPCDRCRRLRMDCVKNLTSCAGCTRKHARCHWREVSRDELGALDHLMDSTFSGTAASGYSPTHVDASQPNGLANGDVAENNDESDDDDSNPLEDLEALGEKEERMRESEEGMQDERDLARQGWEDSLRSAQQLHFMDADSKAAEEEGTEAQPGDIAEHSEESGRATSGSSIESQLASSSATTKRTSYDPVHDQPPEDEDNDNAAKRGDLDADEPAGGGGGSGEMTQVGMPPVHGGFRAVNDTMADTLTVASAGWRAP